MQNAYLHSNITAKGMIKEHINLITDAQRVHKVLLSLVECVVIVYNAREHNPHSRWSEARKENKLGNLCIAAESTGNFLTVDAERALFYWGGEAHSFIQHVSDVGHGLTGAVALRV